jgi:general secretion pathway protein D
VSEVFELNYAKAEDLEAKISKELSSAVHTLQIDKRTNKIIVTGFPDKMAEIKMLVKEFDEASRQVLIETEIWQLSLSKSFQRGINWEKIFRSIKHLDFQGNFPLGLAAAATRGEISVGTGPTESYNATIQLLSTYGKTDMLSRPHIAVLNNEEAKILVGSKEAFITSTVSQAQSSTTTSESVSYIDVGIKINVVPTINKDGFITMKIKPEVSSVRTTLDTAAGSKVPIVETSEVQTIVKVKDGATVLIAGLMKEKTTETREGIPILSRIPVLGWLFGNYEKGPLTEPVKTELIIAITPHIITGEAGSFDASPALGIKGEHREPKEKYTKQ